MFPSILVTLSTGPSIILWYNQDIIQEVFLNTRIKQSIVVTMSTCINTFPKMLLILFTSLVNTVVISPTTKHNPHLNSSEKLTQ